MKECLLLITAVAACGHASSQPAAPPVANTASRTQSETVRIRCEPRGNVVATGPTAGDVPVVVLYERNMWLSGFDVPTLLVWADGTIVYGDEPYGKSFRLFQAKVSPERADEIQRSTVASLHDARAYTEMTNATDEPTVQIIFRDGDTWRVIEAYGMERSTKQSDVPESLREVFATYRALLNARPSERVPAPSGYPRPERWPEELPTFRGQHVVDQLAHCAFRRAMGEQALETSSPIG